MFLYFADVASEEVKFNVSKRTASIDLMVDPVSQQQYKDVAFMVSVDDITPDHKNNNVLSDDSYVIFTVNGNVLSDDEGNAVKVFLDENGVTSYNYTIAPGTPALKTFGSLYDYAVAAILVSDYYEDSSSDLSIYHVEQSPINVEFITVFCDLNNLLHPDAVILDYMGNHVIGSSRVSFSINGVDYVDENGTLIVYTVEDGVVSLDDIKCDEGIVPVSLTLAVLDSPSYFSGENTTYLIEYARYKNDTDDDNGTVDDNGSDKPVPVNNYNAYASAGSSVKTLRTSTVTLHNDMNVTLEVLNNIFNMDFTNGVLLVYLDGKLVFNGTTNDDLMMILFELLDELLGEHELKVVFTDENNNTQTYALNVNIS